MDIDIDFADRDKILSLIKHIPAAIEKDGKMIKHNTGVYVRDVPMDCLNEICGIDYKSAEEAGYLKLDFINMSVYEKIQSEEELIALMEMEPNWKLLQNKEICEKLVHLGNHYDIIMKMKPENIDQLAMILAIIRPSKRHLLGKSWNEIEKTIWKKPDDDSYFFKKSHSYAYAHLVLIHLNYLSLFEKNE